MKARLLGLLILGLAMDRLAVAPVALAQETLLPPLDAPVPTTSQPNVFGSPHDSGAFPWSKGAISKGGSSQEEALTPSQPPPGPAAPMPPPGTDTSPPAAAPTDAREALHDDHIAPEENVWFRGSYLLWWIKNAPLPVPVVTTGSVTGGGALGQPDTVVLFGNSKFRYESFNGFQLEAGLWLEEKHYWGLEAGGFLLQKRSTSNEFSSDASGNPLLARPATDTTTMVPTPFAFLISSPGGLAGSITISSSARLWGASADLVRNLAATPRFRADSICGFRYLDLGEDLTFLQTMVVLPGNELPFSTVAPDGTIQQTRLEGGSTVKILDQFQTRNRIYGGQIGGRFEFYRDSWFVAAITKVALGPNQQSLDISGNTTATTPAGTSLSNQGGGGFLALAGTNIGRHSTNWFVIVPEVNIHLGCQLSSHLLVHVGYDFLFINNVARPGNAVNPNINPTFLPTSSTFGASAGSLPQPRFPFREEDFWAQGVEFGLELRF